MMRRMTGKGLSTRNILGKKGGVQRGGSLTDEMLEETYGLKELPEKQALRVRNLLALLSAIRLCNKAKNLDEAIAVVITATCSILHCDRATLFMVDDIAEELVIRHAVGADDIRIPLTAGIAGAVYQEGKSLNIPEPYKDPRFNKETDKITGYKTESILCLPIFDSHGSCVAVLQAINKLQGSSKTVTKFTTEDEMLLEHMSMQVGVILSNHILTENTKRSHGQVTALLEIVRSLHSNMGINSLMFVITTKSPGLVDAERCSLYLVDKSRNELWSLQGAVEVRAPMDRGLIGACASSGEVINIKDAWEDARFNKEYDKQTGYRTRSVLVMPIRDSPLDAGESPQMVGVLQLINKRSEPVFSNEDRDLLQSFVDIAGSILATSQLFQQQSQKKSTGTGEISLKDLKLDTPEAKAERAKSMRKVGSKAAMKSFKEEELEGEEE